VIGSLIVTAANLLLSLPVKEFSQEGQHALTGQRAANIQAVFAVVTGSFPNNAL